MSSFSQYGSLGRLLIVWTLPQFLCHLYPEHLIIKINCRSKVMSLVWCPSPYIESLAWLEEMEADAEPHKKILDRIQGIL